MCSRFLLTFVALAVPSLAGCQAPAQPAPVASAAPPVAALAPPASVAPEAAAEVEMKAYEVPGMRGPELVGVLKQVLSRGSDSPPLGRATAMDDGRVLVVAGPGIQAGVASLCEALQSETPTEPKTVKLSYWIVYADAAENTEIADMDILSEALNEVAEATGPSRFSLAEHASIASIANTSARTRGKLARFEQVASLHGDTVVADLSIEFNPHVRGMPIHNRLETRMSLEPGETVVLGRSGHLGDEPHDEVLYVVRAELADAQ